MTPPQWALERAALAAVRRSTLREVASLAMQWSPLEAGLPHNFDSWQHAIGLFVERLQRMANEESPDA